MAKLITKTTERAGKGLIVSGDIECQVEVLKVKGRTSFTLKIDGVQKDTSRANAFFMWQWVMDYFNVYEVEAPTKPIKKPRIIKSNKTSK
jgi:hypothetical protein